MGKNKHIKGTTGKNNREAKSRRDPSEDCFPVWIFTSLLLMFPAMILIRDMY